MADIGITFTEANIHHMWPHGPGGRTRRVFHTNKAINSADTSMSGAISMPGLTRPFQLKSLVLRVQQIATVPTIDNRGGSLYVEDVGGAGNNLSNIVVASWVLIQAAEMMIDWGPYPFGTNLIFPSAHLIRMLTTQFDSSGSPTADIRVTMEIVERDPT